ncbi:hypothetical protein OXPF_32940 [Oxobacter pfennigii]|uniref:EF2563 family selenium-dependent molybdenum hydroxylase system protein n=1 Tax=Oxobacter pfennigii TaxID=36849 RepID=A0A0P8W5T3_9CLOT|nr:selenium-dependent molybdenum cofactor biosynthesis protein YqeB [Oxobacter pfennigii]KPU43044.1 hypothetical protein OXPF_32940 [Oxobacter pfennigii]
MFSKHCIIIKGGGDLSSATAHKLKRSGFQVIITELEQPRMVRRSVSFGNCVYEKEWTVEGMTSVLTGEEGIHGILMNGKIPVLIDPSCEIRKKVKPAIIIDAILAKKNLSTDINDAPIVIGLGPGFTAGQDVHAIIETNRGHNLGRIIFDGKAETNTHVPGDVCGYTFERVLRSPECGIIKNHVEIGDIVRSGDIICTVDTTPVYTKIDGIVRGLIKDGIYIDSDYKVGDIDPRRDSEYCYTISDKGRNIAGGVLEAILILLKNTPLA